MLAGPPAVAERVRSEKDDSTNGLASVDNASTSTRKGKERKAGTEGGGEEGDREGLTNLILFHSAASLFMMDPKTKFFVASSFASILLLLAWPGPPSSSSEVSSKYESLFAGAGAIAKGKETLRTRQLDLLSTRL